MEEPYTVEVVERDAERSRVLLARMSPAMQRDAVELMEISWRAGEAVGRAKASKALAGAL